MSTDSSKKRKGRAAQDAPPEGALVSRASEGAVPAPKRTLKGRQPGLLGRLSFLRARHDWGILGGAFFGLLALFGPWFVLAPILQPIIPALPVSTNLKISIADSIVISASFGTILLAIAAYGKNLRSIGFTKPTWRQAGLAAGAFVLYFLLSAALAMAAGHLFPYNQQQPQEIGFSHVNGLELAAAFIPLVILTPITEESIFRGFMFNGFRRQLPFWVAAVGVSVVFGVAHGQVNVGLDVFALSMVSCYLRESTKSLWPSIFLHAIKNGVAFYLLYLYNGH